MPPTISIPFRLWVGLGLAMPAVGVFLSWGWPGLVGAEGAIASDHFEGSSFSGGTGWLTPWSPSGAVDLVREQNPHGGSHHLRLRGTASVERTVDLSAWRRVELSFWAKVSSFEAKDGDRAMVELSDDGGGSWEVLETWRDGDDHNEYRSYEFDLSAMNLTGTLLIRSIALMDDPDDYLYIDDVRFQGEPAPGGTVPSPPRGADGGEVPPFTTEPTARPTGNIVIDGAFGDWTGHAHLLDPSGDAENVRGDLAAFYWAIDPKQKYTYWMIECYPADESDRGDGDEGEGQEYSQIQSVGYTVYLDTDNNGNFTEKHDRRVIVDYQQYKHHSKVRVRVRQGSGSATIFTREGDWGDSEAEGGRRIEFQVSFRDLGISAGDAIRMYGQSDRNDRLPDRGDIQWSPASILGYWLLGTVLVGGAAAIWYIRRRKEKTWPSGRP